MTNKIEAIKDAIMAAFPGAKGVTIYLDSNIMDIKVLPGGYYPEDEIETIVIEGMEAWKCKSLE